MSALLVATVLVYHLVVLVSSSSVTVDTQFVVPDSGSPYTPLLQSPANGSSDNEDSVGDRIDDGQRPHRALVRRKPALLQDSIDSEHQHGNEIENGGRIERGGPRQTKEKLDRAFETAIEQVKAISSEYFLLYGAALGVRREGGPIDHDDDVDIAVPYEDLQTLQEALSDFNPLPSGDCEHAGIYTPGTDEVAMMSFWGYTISKEDPDWLCFPCEAACTDTTQCEWRDAYPKTMFLPAQPVATKVNGLEVQQLHDVDQFLELNYGNDWRTPKAGAKGAHDTRYARYDAHCAPAGN